MEELSVEFTARSLALPQGTINEKPLAGKAFVTWRFRRVGRAYI